MATPLSLKTLHKIFLRKIKLFSEFSPQAIDQLLEHITYKEYKKDNMLFFTGDTADFFYIIKRGGVKLYRQTRDGHESVIAILKEKEVFGKACIVKDSIFPYSAQVILDSVLLKLPASFMWYIASHPIEFNNFFVKFLEEGFSELGQKNLEAEHLAQMTSCQRVGCFLLRMCTSQAECCTTVYLPYEKALVAGKLGMTPETFSRCLHQLTSLGIETHNAKITIHNIQHLQNRICEHCSATKQECILSKSI